jgi:hypothetical protein
MTNQESDVLKEIIVHVHRKRFFYVPKAIVNYYSIKDTDGIRCVLKEKSNNAKMKNAENIDGGILINTNTKREWEIPYVTCEMYDIKDKDYLCLLIEEIIHS